MFHYLGRVNRGPKPGGGAANLSSDGLTALGFGNPDILGPKPGGRDIYFLMVSFVSMVTVLFKSASQDH